MKCNLPIGTILAGLSLRQREPVFSLGGLLGLLR